MENCTNEEKRISPLKHTPPIDELIELPEPSDAQISPDGKYVAYVVRTTDWEQNAYIKQIWIYNAETQRNNQLTFEVHSSWGPHWSPDGQWLLYQRATDSGIALYIASPPSKNEHLLVELENGGYGFRWSPDSQSIAFLAVDENATAHNQQDKELYGDVRVAGEQELNTQLWRVTLADKMPCQLTCGSFSITNLDWHPNGDLIAFSACPSADESDWDRSRIYILDIITGEVKLVTKEGCHSPRWAPIGDQIAFCIVGDPSFAAINTIGIISINTNEKQNLRPFDNVSCLLGWGYQGILALAIDRINAHIYCVDPLTGEADQLTPDDVDGFTITEGWIGLGCNFTRDFSHSSFVSYDIEHYAEVTVLDLESRTVEYITDFTQGIANWKMGTPEIIGWTSDDGVSIEGILTKPDGFQAGKAYPLVVVPHGGPTATSMLPPLVDRDSWNCTIPQLIGKGALVLQPNYRGSCGYGEEFQMLNIPEVGLVEYRDIISGVDALVQRGWVDPARIGIVGTSHGGYLALFAAMYDDRFRAVAMLSGISDLTTHYCLADTQKWARQYLQGNPWEKKRTYQNASPLTYALRTRTPVLIQHGENDQRAPIANAQLAYRALKDCGANVRLVTYPGMGHGIAKPRQLRRFMKEVVDWFGYWLWGDKHIQL